VILVDSSVWIDHFRNIESDAVRRPRGLISEEPLLIGNLILCEILQGFNSEAEARLVQRLFTRFEPVALSDPGLAAVAAANYRFLRRQGITIRKTIDVIIGTFCVERGHALLHSERDFAPMERFLGLRTV
jgi:predicted nucleic acid-binding protein